MCGGITGIIFVLTNFVYYFLSHAEYRNSIYNAGLKTFDGLLEDATGGGY